MAFPAIYAITANSLTAETFRQAPSSLVAGTGVVGSGDLAVSALSTPNMSVDVAPGQIWIPGTLASTTGFGTNLNAQTGYGLPSAFNEQGCYQAWNNGTVNVVIAAADPTNPRIDIIVAYVQDAEYAGSANQGVIGVVTGTAAATPAAPAAPASAVVLAQVAVAAGVTSITSGDITDVRPIFALRNNRLATAPPASGGTSILNIALNSVSQNSLPYDLLLTGSLTVNAAGSIGVAVGSGPTNPPPLTNVFFYSASIPTGTPIPFTFYVPAGYYCEVAQSGGTGTLDNLDYAVFPV